MVRVDSFENLERSDGDIDILKTYLKTQRVPRAAIEVLEGLTVEQHVSWIMDGVTGAGLFGKLHRPGAPTEFIDSRTAEEFLASGDFERSMESLGYHREEGSAQWVKK
jgi:hypothetical protein